MSQESQSLGELISRVTGEFSTLMREEVALAKAEIQQSVSRLTTDAVMVIVGGVIAYTGFLALVAAAILGLARNVAPWLSALLIGLAILLGGVFMLLRGLRDLRNVGPIPERTKQTLKEDAAMVKEKLS